MKLYELDQHLRQDPEYVKAEKELKPFLDLSHAVIHARIEKGWSQSELARRVGTKQANISRIESALGNPTLDLIRRLSDVLEFKIDFPVPVQAVCSPVSAKSVTQTVSFENSLQFATDVTAKFEHREPMPA